MKRLVLLLFACACARRETHPPVIVISIDTLRADHVSARTTPHIYALSRDGIVFRNAWSHSPLTLPSHLSMFTGMLPPEHGVRDNAGYRFDPRTHPTLAAALRANGYRTGAAVSAYVLRATTGVAAGFDEYDDAIGLVDGAPVGALQRSGDVTEGIAERWIAAQSEKPFFFFLHLYEPHTPYTPTYDADVAHADAIVGKFLGFLRQRGLYDRAVIVLLSDHGEGLMDHGEQEHGVLLYRESLQVPLIVKPPGARRHREVDSPVSLIDVMPTILELAGCPAPRTRGRSLMNATPTAPIYSESLYARIHLGCGELRSIVDRDRHVIDGARGEVYDLRSDPAERVNVIDRERRAYANARAAIAQVGGAFVTPDAIDAEEAKKLAALGYVSGGSDSSATSRDARECLGDLAQLKEVATLKGSEAIARLESMLAANPRWSDIRDQLGAAYDDAGDHLRAARLYEDGIRATPRLAGAFALSAASSLFDAHRFDEAAAHAHAAETTEPAGAHLLLGEIALARNDLATAAREQSIAASFRNSRGHALFLAARIAAAQHEFARALELLKVTNDTCRQDGESLPRGFHYAAGDALAHLGRTADAEREFAAEIAADPHDVQPYADLALLQIMRRDRAAALQTIDRMAAANPSRDTYRFAAESLDRWGEHEAAARWRKKE
ncbi:MAG: sulfatase-like hydrolase/transferase [Acidobacteria bacterium]|nr:sulfatase-like hydrolase/transferase [Acidobacteriota bacterium]MBV9071977.1 sulfatase-like hydrolase/transferase [Acidobacteriota bacterium]MBV9187109.1 sulfatase-like hydrolase/transferase [Acidobacteriota bacterium]